MSTQYCRGMSTETALKHPGPYSTQDSKDRTLQISSIPGALLLWSCLTSSATSTQMRVPISQSTGQDLHPAFNSVQEYRNIDYKCVLITTFSFSVMCQLSAFMGLYCGISNKEMERRTYTQYVSEWRTLFSSHEWCLDSGFPVFTKLTIHQHPPVQLHMKPGQHNALKSTQSDIRN